MLVSPNYTILSSRKRFFLILWSVNFENTLISPEQVEETSLNRQFNIPLYTIPINTSPRNFTFDTQMRCVCTQVISGFPVFILVCCIRKINQRYFQRSVSILVLYTFHPSHHHVCPLLSHLSSGQLMVISGQVCVAMMYLQKSVRMTKGESERIVAKKKKKIVL